MAVHAQRELKIGRPIEHSGSVPAKICPNDIWGKPCAKLKIIAPQQILSFKADENIIVSQEKAIGGYELFVSTSNSKKNILISGEGHKPLKISLSCNDEQLTPREAYSLFLEVGEDINAGKAYVTFQSDKNKNYIVLINGKEYKSDDKGDVVLQLPYGTYSYTTKATDHEDKVGHIVLIDKPQYEDANLAMQQGTLNIMTDTLKNVKIYVDDILQKDSSPLLDVGTHKVVTELVDSTYSKTIRLNKEGVDIDMHIAGKLKVNTLHKAYVYIWPEENSVGPSQQQYRGDVNLNLLGRYKVGVWKRGYHVMMKDVNIPVRGSISEDFSLKRMISSCYFLEYTSSIKAPYGLTLGYVNRVGLYVSMKFSGEMIDSEKEADGLGYETAYKLDYDEDMSSYEKDKHYQVEITGGLLFAINRWFYIFGGGGYGEFGDFYKQSDKYYLGKRNYGAIAEGGIKIKIAHIFFTGGIKSNFGNHERIIEPMFGLGFTFGTERNPLKNLNPIVK
jgi:hypothetical protein